MECEQFNLTKMVKLDENGTTNWGTRAKKQLQNSFKHFHDMYKMLRKHVMKMFEAILYM